MWTGTVASAKSVSRPTLPRFGVFAIRFRCAEIVRLVDEPVGRQFNAWRVQNPLDRPVIIFNFSRKRALFFFFSFFHPFQFFWNISYNRKRKRKAKNEKRKKFTLFGIKWIVASLLLFYFVICFCPKRNYLQKKKSNNKIIYRFYWYEKGTSFFWNIFIKYLLKGRQSNLQFAAPLISITMSISSFYYF